MKAMKKATGMRKTAGRMTAMEKRGMMLRRTTNHNVHMLTPHGRLTAGRKGRKG